ncbi:MAG: hypothetical protein CMO35_06015 [Verrucomicrobiaceae bacterium]|nr:hypothetical protein [Verrucomicrobiaceae bacterium]
MSPKQQADPEIYGNAWGNLLQQVRNGLSWSGRELNSCLLNDGTGGFVDVSSVIGLDQEADGRALALVDWDQDGDIDLWYRDRTAPRLRLMLNRHKGTRTEDFVSVLLEGEECNRNAIGAVVELVGELGPGKLRSVKSVRAGDLFLSQSSRWLHFGLGQDGEAGKARVIWPGGGEELFQGLKAGGRFLLKEGSGYAVPVGRTSRVIADDADSSVPVYRDATAHINPPVAFRLPPLRFRSPRGERGMLPGKGSPQLIILWSAECPVSRMQLKRLAEKSRSYRVAGVPLVIALSVDGEEGRGKAAEVMQELRWPFEWGSIENISLDVLSTFQKGLFDLTVPLTVPLAVLCGSGGEVMGIYRGSFEASVVADDLKALRRADGEGWHAWAPPMAGRWFTKAVDPVYAMEFMARQFDNRFPEVALSYLEAAQEHATGAKVLALASGIARRHHELAKKFRKQQQPEQASVHFERALALEPRAEFLLDYGTMLASYGNLGAAAGLLREALELEPGLEPARRALEMVQKLQKEGR